MVVVLLPLLHRDSTTATSAAETPVACDTPAGATRDVIGDGRRPTLVRRLFAADAHAVPAAVAVMQRTCASEGYAVAALDRPLALDEGTTMRSVVAVLPSGDRYGARPWARLIALAARDHVELVAVMGRAPHRACRPSIAWASPDARRARVAERAERDLAPTRRGEAQLFPVNDEWAARVARLMASGRRGYARQVLSAALARAERRDGHGDALTLRVAAARLAHDDLRPAEVCRLLLPILRDSDEAGLDPVRAPLGTRLEASLFACHASIDTLAFGRARALAGAAGMCAEATGLFRFDAMRAQWRVSRWLGDVDGALASARAMAALARSAHEQVICRRCLLLTTALRWPDEADAHRRWLRAHADSADRPCAADAWRALAEEALAVGDTGRARTAIEAAFRAHGRRATPRRRASLALLAAAGGIRRGARVEPPPRPVGDTALMALCRDATGAGASARLRRRVEQRAEAVGLSLEGIAPWRRPTGDHVMIEDLVQVIEACHTDEGAPAMARLCSLVREQLGAAGVGLYTTPDGRPLAGVGTHPCVSTSVSREALTRNVVVAPAAAAIGVESAVPVRFGGTPIAALCCRWAYDAPVDGRRAALVMTAAAAVCAPVVQAAIEARGRADLPGDDLGLLGISDAMRVLRGHIRRAALAPFPVLIEGESGAGKELVARAIHAASPRRGRRFCAVNCAAVSDDLLEAELFGHARGAFTGAIAERPGLFEDADGGTLFLDEIGELSPRGQAKLLRVLQDGEVRRVGENTPRRLDVRVVAATNRILAREVEVGRFRDDLRFRLDVVRIEVPPLRTRPDDIEILAQAFWRDALGKTRGRAVLDRDAVAALARYDWPGNVRELQNVIATLAVRAPQRGRVTEDDVTSVRAAAAPRSTPPAGSLDAARREFDAALLRQTLAECGGRRTEAARRLGLTRQGLLKLMYRLGLDRSRPVEGVPSRP